ncbi:MAG: carbon-nitrogen hydrolase family protein [Planctomycetota bacterium]|nr:MAG: carbon-nitrogen hydrolase family protein [Planctomycetota bacterium]GDY10741.1 hypothetical protein LBMAG52_42290 [Planctomycetia bacterium]
MTTLRIALAQCRQTDDFDANARTIVRFFDEAAKQRAQIVCFPETQTVPISTSTSPRKPCSSSTPTAA